VKHGEEEEEKDMSSKREERMGEKKRTRFSSAFKKRGVMYR